MTDQRYTLSARYITKRYKKRVVVDHISIHIDNGEVVGLLGPNGAGKTTLFYMMVGLIPPDQGDVYFGEHTITSLAIHERARLGIGYLPQEASIFRKLSAANNILSVLELRQELGKEQRLEKLEALLKEFHLTHIRDTLGISLSGGERRRVEIARCMALEPKFILLDEPFAGIDPISVADIKKMIHQLKAKGIGVLITDHNVRETLDICEKGYIINQGNILCQGSPKAILENKQVREVYLGETFNL